MRKKHSRLVSMLLALALVLNVVLATPLTVAAEYVDGSITYPDGLVVDGSTGWNSGGGDQYLLTGDFDVTITFTNEPFVSIRPDPGVITNYDNFVFEIFGGADTKGITLRADAFGWTYDSGSQEPFYTVAVTWDWANYIEMCRANTYVTLNLRKASNNVVRATAEFKTSENGTTGGVMTYAIVYPDGVPESMRVQVGADYGKITIWKCEYNTPTAINSVTKDDLDIDAYYGAFAPDDTLSGDFKIVYSFNNASKDTSLVWNNFIVAIFGDGLNIIARADPFDIAGTLTAWGSNIDDWTIMTDADVTVTVERIGDIISLIYYIDGAGKTFSLTSVKAFDTLPDELNVRLTGEQVKLTNIKATIYDYNKADDDDDDDDEYDPSTDTAIVYGNITDRVSVHDPSIVKDEESGYYYVFGSHMAWARSTDLIHWQTFTNNINRNYSKLFVNEAAWASHGSSSYDLSGNLWAPDVIWNEDMGKWCMYMSVNGDNWYTSVALLTADNIEGPYTYVGPVVYSGFTNAAEAAETDLEKVIGTNEVPSRYLQNRNGNRTYGMNAIDPCVTYDDNGDLWMTYGSWFGGIYMLKLDNETGLRDYSHTYALNEGVSDPYQGLKIAGGDHSSGEASYLEKIGGYWYLFMSYGGLTANGGYNMRVFRSKSIEGPYVDLSGDDANYASYYNNVNGTVGNRLMTYYQWSYMDKGQVAQGHNSAFVDNDGKAYVVYHTRFNDGTEGHEVRVHQLFTNEDGWLVTAPFEYAGEALSADGINAQTIAGKYEVLFHTGTNYANVDCVTGQTVTFGADGTLSGAIEGTWKLSGYNVTLTSEDGKTYKGVFVKQKMEEQDKETLCFTVLGSDEISVWGYKYPYSNEEFIDMVAEKLGIPIGTFAQNIALPSVGLYDVDITWSSDNTAIITNDGKVTVPAQDTVVTMTATMTLDETVKKYEYPIKVFSSKKDETEKYLIWEYFTNEEQDLSDATEGSLRFPNPFNGSNVLGISIYNGVSIEFEVTPNGGMQFLSNILSMNAGAQGGLYFTGGSYLGYNATGGWFDANVNNSAWTAGTDFIGSGAKIRIDLHSTGFEVYVNDVLAYTQADIGGSVPGGTAIDSYASVLNYLRNTATDLNFGWGSWWNGGFNGTISNVKLYAEPVDWVDTSGYVYYEDYNNTADTGWISPNAQGSLSIKNAGDSHSGYLDFAVEDVSGNRGAYTNFPPEANLSSGYIVEADIKMTPGNVADRSMSQFAITGMDAAYDSNNYNNGIVSGYILKLSTNEANSTTYYINDGEQSVVIPSNTWIHIRAVVANGTDVLAEITINGETKTFTTEVNGNGVLKGLYLLRGRGSGTASVDNIAVSKFHYGEPEFNWSEDGKTASAVFPCEEGEDYNITVDAEVTGEVKTEPTCEDKGTTTYTAAVEFEGETYTDTKDVEDIPAKGHTPTEPVIEELVEATCTEEGSYDEVVYCAECDKELSRTSKTIEALGHIRPEWPTIETEDKEVTCGEAASYREVYYCTRCHEELESIEYENEPLPHNAGEVVIENEVEATCTEDGSHEEVVYCTRCGEELERNVIVDEKLGHDPGDVIIEEGEPATCTEDGFHYEIVRCNRCENVIENKKVTDEKLGHDPDDPVVEKEIAATCSAAGSYDEVVYCTVCGEELSRTTKTIDKIAHTPGEAKIENKIEPACDAEGSYEEVVYCTVCGEELSRTVIAIDKIAHTPGEPRIENENAASCAAEGSYDEVVYCTVCGEEVSRSTNTIAKLAHTPGETKIENKKEATCDEDGSYDEVVYCTVCQEELSRTAKTISATGHKDEDENGKCDLCGECLHEHDSDGLCIEDSCQHDDDCCPKRSESEEPPISEDPSVSETPESPDPTEKPSENGSVDKNVQVGADAPKTSILMDEEELMETVLNEAEKEAVENGAHVEIVLSVDVKEIVEPENAALVEEAVAGVYVVGMYLELNLNIYIDNELSRAVTMIDEPIYITVDIPEDMYAIGRKYVIIREHNGQVDILEDLDSDPGTITFKTDRFSTYAIGYTNEEGEEEPSEPSEPYEPSEPSQPEPTEPDDIPNTGYDPNMAVRVTVMFLSAAALLGTVYIKRRVMSK